jgi:hypothetical protein
MNFLFGRIFWVTAIVQLCPATDRVAFSSSRRWSYVADGTVLDIFSPFLQNRSLHFTGICNVLHSVYAFVVDLLIFKNLLGSLLL